MVSNLQELLSYTNSEVLAHYTREHAGTSDEETRLLFQDLMGWMWVSLHRSEKSLSSPMLAPLQKLDEMWHLFILHTRAYSAFCQQYFGQYFHHDVQPDNQSENTSLSPQELMSYLEDCYDYLGESWVRRNFALSL